MFVPGARKRPRGSHVGHHWHLEQERAVHGPQVPRAPLAAPGGAAAPHVFEERDMVDVERGNGLDAFDFANEPEPWRAAIPRRRRPRRRALARAEDADADAAEALADIEAGSAGDHALGDEGDFEEADSDSEPAAQAAQPEPPAPAAPAAAAPAAEPDVGGAPAQGQAGGVAAARRRRVDVPDGITLPGDVSADALALAEQRFLPLCLHDWATRHLVPQVAVTALLRMFHGRFGQILGVKRIHLVRRGNIPQTATTAFDYSAEVTDALGLDMLRPGKVFLPAGDFNLVGRGTERFVTYWAAPKLMLNVAYKLMNPALNAEETPMLYDINPALPAGMYCGPTYYSAAELRDRRAAYERALAALPAVLARLLPGVTVDQVRIICIGLNAFFDGVNPRGNQADDIFAFLLGITNLHPAVAQSPHGVVVGGFWNAPRVLRKAKIAHGDVAMTASPLTMSNEATVTAMLYKNAVAKPLQELLEGEPLVMHTRCFPGLAYVPQPVCRSGAWHLQTTLQSARPPRLLSQYVALVGYLAHVSADHPVEAELTGKTEHHCHIDGAHGGSLADVSPFDTAF